MENRLFDLCSFAVSPVDKDVYVSGVKECLKSGIPATITTKDVQLAAELQEKLNQARDAQGQGGQKDDQAEANDEEQSGEIDGGDTGTTPLHRISETVSKDTVEVALEMIDILFQYGANWLMLDDNNDTPGCIALRRNVDSRIYDKFVTAGVRSEVFLRRMTEETDTPIGADASADASAEASTEAAEGAAVANTAGDNDAYLKADLEYTDHNLVTEQQDGVMMDWEDPIMKRSAELLCQSREQGGVLLNVGFGMGIIDKYIQGFSPKKHYISEAHPKVLEKMRKDGWYDKPNVVVLEGRWQDTVPKLLDQGVFFDGIYYDTFSEHYQDLVDFFDVVVGLLSPEGTFSFFNGLGADRQICYDVYCQVVEVDLQDYGLQVEYETMEIAEHKKDERWKDIKMQYWALKQYHLPKIHFMAI